MPSPASELWFSLDGGFALDGVLSLDSFTDRPLGPTALGEWRTSVPIPIPVGLARTAQHQAGHRRTRQGREQRAVCLGSLGTEE